MDFNNKVVLITGASSGIGAAIAIHLSKLSAKLALVGRNENNLKRIAMYCEKAKGLKPLVLVADVTVDEEAARVVAATLAEFGALDVLVNSAGVIGMGGLKECSMEVFDRVMATNVRAVFRLSGAATPALTAARGCIVNVSCLASLKPSAAALAYSASKAALDQLTRCAALELAPDVRVNCVNPGLVKTNLLKGTGLTEEQLELFVRNVVGSTPLRRPVQADEVAALVAFLASERAAAVTGACYPLDGGASLK